MARDFDRWLKERLNITFTVYMNLSEEDRQLLLSDYQECRRQEADKALGNERRKQENLKKYLQKLRLRRQKKIDEFSQT
jgi:hypothetical protein